MSNTSDFILLKEDHTLGNLLAEFLKQQPQVLMAGYKSKTASGEVVTLGTLRLTITFLQLPILMCRKS